MVIVIRKLFIFKTIYCWKTLISMGLAIGARQTVSVYWEKFLVFGGSRLRGYPSWYVEEVSDSSIPGSSELFLSELTCFLNLKAKYARIIVVSSAVARIELKIT